MSAASEPPLASPAGAPARSLARAYAGISLLLVLGTVLFAAGVIAKVRWHDGTPPPMVLGVAAWQVATAGFVSTLAGGLWARRLVG